MEGIVIALLIMSIPLVISIAIIGAICRYQAKENAKAFNYDRLAQRIAEEICKRMLIIERQKAEAKEIKEEWESSNA